MIQDGKPYRQDLSSEWENRKPLYSPIGVTFCVL